MSIVLILKSVILLVIFDIFCIQPIFQRTSMMAAAVVARRFVPQMHSPHIERGRGMMKKKDRKKTKGGD